MLKLIVLIVIGFVIYKIFFEKKNISMQNNHQQEDDELIECSNCHTFVPKNECKFTKNGCLCKECQ